MSEHASAVGKVTAFIVRERDGMPEIVVFNHPEPDGGVVVQVPAGTIEPGEEPATAALREACEETGLPSFVLDRPLGEVRSVRSWLAPDEWVVAETVEGAEQWLRRGIVARVVEHDGKQTLAVSPISDERRWIPASSLTRNIIRYLFALRPTGDVPEEWRHSCDCGAPIRLNWLSLDEAAARLHPVQAEWLEAARAALFR